MRQVLSGGFLALVLLVSNQSPVSADCTPEPASQWAPAGFVCGPVYGEGWASTYPGHGVARNDCTYPWTDCEPITITSLDTGRSVTVIPVTWCHCWTKVTGPNGETQRIVDLDPGTLARLGLGGSQGLYRVTVYPAGEQQVTLPDTAYRMQGDVDHAAARFSTYLPSAHRG